MVSQQDKCASFADLHRQPGAFVIPNPWDAGSAKLLEALGFAALATTSAGFAHTLALADGRVSLEQKLTHATVLAAATNIPINVDFENGFADDPADVAANVLRIAKTGVAGCSVEDFQRDTQTLYDLDLAVERVQAAAEAVATLGMPFLLTARAENLLRGVNDVDATLRRLQAFSAAGADVLYAPGVRSLEDLHRITAELAKPFNVLAPFMPGATVAEFSDAGAKRISLGSALSSATITPLLNAAREMLTHGTFSWMAAMAPAAELRQLLDK